MDEKQRLIDKYETPTAPICKGNVHLCPECNKRVTPKHNYCHRCGKMLKW